MQRKIFAKQLMMLIRKSGLRQIELASRIGVSSAAISQFVHGTTLPTPHHMELIFDVFKTPAKTRSQLQYQLMLARSEPRRLGDNKNKPVELMPIRSSQGYTITEVAARTGISVDRIIALEENPTLALTNEEKLQFSQIYGVNFDAQDVSLESPSEDGNIYHKGGAPLIMVSDLIDFDRQEETIDEFAWRNIRNFVSQVINGVPRPVFAQAFSDEVGFRHDGLLQIVLSETRPYGFAPMELRMYEGGVFRLWQPGSDNAKRDDLPSFETHGTLVWSIPVVEVILKPLKFKSK